MQVRMQAQVTIKIRARRRTPAGYKMLPRPQLVVVDETSPAEVTLAYSSLAADAPLEGLIIKGKGGRKITQSEAAEAVRNLPFYMEQAEAFLRNDEGELARLGRMQTRRPYRRLTDAFLTEIATKHSELVATGNAAPVRELGRRHGVSEGNASKWIKAARERGLTGVPENL